jgi:predicted esterase
MTLLRSFIFSLLLVPGALYAAEEFVVLDDGSQVKVFLFFPRDHGEGPWPLTVLMSGGTANEYVVRAQFWLGHELANRGWVIAVPVSPDSSSFLGKSGEIIPQVIDKLQLINEVEAGKSLLVGVSNGGSSALEIANRHPERYLGVVAVPGMIANNAELADFKGLPIFLRIGENDYLRWNNRLPALEQTLSRAGAIVNARLEPGASHVFPINWDELQPWLDAILLESEPSHDILPLRAPPCIIQKTCGRRLQQQ